MNTGNSNPFQDEMPWNLTPGTGILSPRRRSFNWFTNSASPK